MDGQALDRDAIDTLRRVLSDHGVSFAVLFGSAARESMDEHSDVDVAIEFEDCRPTDDGYSDRYGRLCTDLDDELPVPVDVVDVHTMSSRFAHAALEDGTLLVGSEERRSELLDAYGGTPPTIADARERVTAAVERLRDGSTG